MCKTRIMYYMKLIDSALKRLTYNIYCVLDKSMDLTAIHVFNSPTRILAHLATVASYVAS